MDAQHRWQFWIDRGGTFTDCLGRDPRTGSIRVAKILSSDQAPLVGIRQLLGLKESEPIPPCDVRIGTTVATNALLQRAGVSCLLVTTRGFRDLLEIGTQARPDLFALEIRRPALLYDAVLEVDARCDPEGQVLSWPDPAATHASLARIRASGITSAAIVLIHAYRAPTLECEVGELARLAGFRYVSLSHQIACELGLLSRGDTTTVDAYLTPLLKRYIEALQAELPGSTLRFMQSSGGLAEADRFRGPAALLSGPAAGVVACSHVARAAGIERAIGFDMGGTSTDVSRYAGEFERTYEVEISQVRVRAPMLHVHTVAAGGGSVCRLAGNRFTVGPDSAGADPGPLCYGAQRAKALTVTDVNLVLGRLQPDRFPFGLNRDRPVRALQGIRQQLRRDGLERTLEEIAEGFLSIANHNMAEAIRQVSVAKGYDVREYALIVFGGAGGQHGCALASELGVRTLVYHPLAGVLSAYGMGLADVSWSGAHDAGRRRLSADTLRDLQPVFERLTAAGREALQREGCLADEAQYVRCLDLRYQGTDTSLTLQAGSAEQLNRQFTELHTRQFGYARHTHPIEILTARVEACARWQPSKIALANPKGSPRAEPLPVRHARLWHAGNWHRSVPLYEREALTPGQRIAGPALILEATATIVVDPDFTLEVLSDGVLIARQLALPVSSVKPPVRATPHAERPDPVLLEVMGNRFKSIAEQMGQVLRKTAVSTNIRERLDFSCAVFDPQGGLVANAPHIPVHLGAMGESVRSLLATNPEMLPGEVYVTNDPAAGGSHLPDLTAISCVHGRDQNPLFFVASRGHHADVGGLLPGSMPPASTCLEEEGVVIRNLRVVRGGKLQRELVLQTLQMGRYPARNPHQNLADLQAQIAANCEGARLLGELVRRCGLATVVAYMAHVQDDAAEQVAEQIGQLPDGRHSYCDRLDDGTPICVALEVTGGRMVIDFQGTGTEHPGNLNAPRAVTVAAVIYFLRTLLGTSVPLNSGCLRPVQLRIPPGSILDPGAGCAVAGGNVETAQRVVDVLLAAAGRAAASQGTMNNLCFGDERFGYYETIAGGAGAGPGYAGASGVHTHMTNTRCTDAEVLETRYPVRLREFSIRRGSGGSGLLRGGDGLVRELEFLAPLQVTILSQRRATRPFGLAGGGPGASGRNLLSGGPLPGCVSLLVKVGDRLRIETPGGGGYGGD